MEDGASRLLCCFFEPANPERFAGRRSRTSFTRRMSLSPRRSSISFTAWPRARTPTPTTIRPSPFFVLVSLLADLVRRSYTPTIEYFSSIVMPMPLSGKPEPKRRFLPSKWEHKKVRLVLSSRRTLLTPALPGHEDCPRNPHWSHCPPPSRYLLLDSPKAPLLRPLVRLGRPLRSPPHAHARTQTRPPQPQRVVQPSRGVPLDGRGEGRVRGAREGGQEGAGHPQEARCAQERRCVPRVCPGALRAVPRPLPRSSYAPSSSSTRHQGSLGTHPQAPEPQGPSPLPYHLERHLPSPQRRQDSLRLDRPYGNVGRHRCRGWRGSPVGVQCRSMRDEVEVRRRTDLRRRMVPRQGSCALRSRFVRPSFSPPPLSQPTNPPISELPKSTSSPLSPSSPTLSPRARCSLRSRGSRAPRRTTLELPRSTSSRWRSSGRSRREMRRGRRDA